MFLNETKPPLDEAMAHVGIKGMRWGRRKAEDESDDFFRERAKSRKTKVAVGALAVVGTGVALTVLHKHGHLSAKSLAKPALGLLGKAMKERERNNWIPKKDYDFPTPKVGVNEAPTQGPSTEALIRDGARVVHSLDDSFWDMPVSATRKRF